MFCCFYRDKSSDLFFPFQKNKKVVLADGKSIVVCKQCVVAVNFNDLIVFDCCK
jgi:hypothetical protein